MLEFLKGQARAARLATYNKPMDVLCARWIQG